LASEILRGGAEKVAEAGGVLAGGHTLDDDEPKYGLSVMGIVHPDRVWTKAAARPGDALVLTKPLGVGIITTAFKGDVADPVHVAAAVESMKRLNRHAMRLIQRVDVRAATDITGFALLGHGYEMAEKSGVRLRLRVSEIPFLAGARDYADMWLFPAGTCNNEQAYEQAVTFAPGIEEEMQQLLYTPETSGGLLVAVPGEKVDELIQVFDAGNHPCWLIGEVVEGEGIEVVP
jgi:selenide,water dikinase